MSINGDDHAHRCSGHNRLPLLNTKRPIISLAHLFERVNRQGKRYLVGRLGTGKVLIVPTGGISRGEPVWQILLGEWPRDAAVVRADLANVEDR
jgi:hypothetical protein